jgi:hypothetical protein
LSEDERYLVADDVVQRLQQHGDPWRLSEELPEATGKGYSTPPMETKPRSIKLKAERVKVARWLRP